MHSHNHKTLPIRDVACAKVWCSLFVLAVLFPFCSCDVGQFDPACLHLLYVVSLVDLLSLRSLDSTILAIYLLLVATLF